MSVSSPCPDRPGKTAPDQRSDRYPPGQLSMVPAWSASSAGATETPPDGRARLLGADTSTMRDLTYATALLEASERMHGQSDLGCLLPLVVTEASALISTDCAAIIRFAGIRRRARLTGPCDE